MAGRGPQTTAPPTPDGQYLAEALQRVGRQCAPFREVSCEALDGGRTGVSVTRLVTDAGQSFVLKRIPRTRPFNAVLQHEGEAVAWQAGSTRTLPEPLTNPAIDASLHPEHDEWWLLMDDVAEGIVPRDVWAEPHTLQLFEALAELHASWWDRGGPPQGLADLGATTSLLVEISRLAATGRASASWAPKAAEAFQVPEMLMPAFLEAAGQDNAAYFQALLARWPEITRALKSHTPTLLHGDPRRANVAFLRDQVYLFDWEFAALGPAAVDLTWHWFLQYWAYIPDDGRTLEQRFWLRDAYLEILENRLGHAVDRAAFQAAWDLGWLRVFCQLGFVLIDGLEARPEAERQAIIDEAFEHSRRIVHDQLA